MNAATLPVDRPPAPGKRLGILLVNLGTPAAPTARAVRRYLAEFLSDERIVDYPRALWLPLLHGVILNVRPAKTARAYRSIWREETDESPLRYWTRRQSERLAAALGAGAIVEWAMRYGAPSIRHRLAAMREAGAARILVLPLYPQYSETTNASVADAVARALRRENAGPSVRIAGDFHDHPIYIGALKVGLDRHLAALGWAPERVVLSFHGLPKRLIDAGDPYFAQCAATASLLQVAMGWSPEFAPMTFQSKFGVGEWLKPGTEETLAALGAAGVKRVAVATPGFVADCIETLEEIAIRAREIFLEAGGDAFAALPCLNADDGMIALLQAIIDRENAAPPEILDAA